MEIEGINGILLRDIFKVVSSMIDTLILSFNIKKGLYFQSMDKSCVMFISFLLSKNNFDNFLCDNEISIGIDAIILEKIITNNVSKNTIVNISYNKDISDKITFTFNDHTINNTKIFQMKLLMIDQDQIQKPNLTYNTKIIIDSPEFKHICNSLSILGEEVIEINVYSSDTDIKCIKFTSEGELANGELIYTPSDLLSINSKVDNFNGIYSLKYLSNIIKSSILSKKVILKMSEGLPLYIRFNFDNYEKSYILFYLAPKLIDIVDE